MYRKLILILLPAALFFGCAGARGTLVFTANGEDFITDGFTSKEGWNLTFDHVYVNLADIQSYSPESRNLKAAPEGPYLVDLAGRREGKTSKEVTVLENCTAGNYQSLRFSLKQLGKGEYKGYSIILQGKGEKEGKTVPFTIKLNEELTFDGREGYVGDSIKGLLEKGGRSDVEMTFHFDHLFGDVESGADDHVNSGSPGFALFLDYEKNGEIDVAQDEMKDNRLYPVLIGAIETLGHLGEGHCEVVR